jgi:type IV pilus assembly protein PilO
MKSPNIDFSAVQRQFEGLQGRHPGIWPLLPRSLLLLGVVLVLVLAGWFAYWSGLLDTWNQGKATEEQLKGEYRTKVAEAVNLPELRKQKVQVEQYVGVLEKQLPSRAEMDALLRDINNSGVGRGAQLMLFKPGDVQVKQHYVELPIQVKVVGNYHDLASFSSDLANLPRIVTLNNIAIMRQPKNGNVLEMDAIAKTFRYLDAEEAAAQEAAKSKAAKK